MLKVGRGGLLWKSSRECNFRSCWRNVTLIICKVCVAGSLRLIQVLEAQSGWNCRFCRREPRKKSPVTPPGIDPGTPRLVAQCLNHHATPGPISGLLLYPKDGYNGSSETFVPLNQAGRRHVPETLILFTARRSSAVVFNCGAEIKCKLFWPWNVKLLTL